MGCEIFVAMNMEVIIVWDMMPMSGSNLTVRRMQQAALKFWYIPTRLHDIASQTTAILKEISLNVMTVT